MSNQEAYVDFGVLTEVGLLSQADVCCQIVLVNIMCEAMEL